MDKFIDWLSDFNEAQQAFMLSALLFAVSCIFGILGIVFPAGFLEVMFLTLWFLGFIGSLIFAAIGIGFIVELVEQRKREKTYISRSTRSNREY